MNYYEALGLAPALSLDLDDLKKRFYDRSRQWHPDRFSRATPAEQQSALDMTALLNDAFRALRDPVARAEYFLKEQGLDTTRNEAPPELLEEVFELNMALEELRGGDTSARGQLTDARERFGALLRESDEELSSLFSQYDFAPSDDALHKIRATLNRRRYIANLVRDVDKELHVHSAN
jgi:molecular chaperone HscB